MPDADKVHKGLSYRHQKVYQQICEGVMTPSELAFEELGAMKKELHSCGQAPFLLIPEVGKLLSAVPTGPLLNPSVDWNGICRDIERKGQKVSLQTSANKRIMALVVDACIDQVRDIQQNVVPDNLEVDAMQRFTVKLYEANFEDRIQLAHHYKDAAPEMVNARVEAMRQSMEDGLGKLAEQAVRDGSFEKVKRPARPSGTIQPINLNDDLLTLGVAP